jgi:hypothetical protein
MPVTRENRKSQQFLHHYRFSQILRQNTAETDFFYGFLQLAVEKRDIFAKIDKSFFRFIDFCKKFLVEKCKNTDGDNILERHSLLLKRQPPPHTRKSFPANILTITFVPH